jgi:hypothetical protein
MRVISLLFFAVAAGIFYKVLRRNAWKTTPPDPACTNPLPQNDFPFSISPIDNQNQLSELPKHTTKNARNYFG